jgi:hypothetical protein
MSSVKDWVNKPCAVCNCVELTMKQVGAVFICEKCFQAEFETVDPVNLEREKYLKWLNLQTQTENNRCSKPSKAVSNE